MSLAASAVLLTVVVGGVITISAVLVFSYAKVFLYPFVLSAIKLKVTPNSLLFSLPGRI